MTAETISTRLRLPAPSHARLTRQAERHGCSLHQCLMMAVESWLALREDDERRASPAEKRNARQP